MNDRGRRAVAAVAVAAGALGFAGPARDALADADDLRTPEARDAAADRFGRFECLRDAIAELPHRPTYVEFVFELPGVEWYQRATEMAFGQLPLVADADDAEQQLEIVVVPPGTGTCDGLDVQLRPR